MGYIDDKLGIKSAIGFAKHLRTKFNVDLDVVKIGSSLSVFWAHGDRLHRYDIKASVIYVITEEDVLKVYEEIEKSLCPAQSQA